MPFKEEVETIQRKIAKEWDVNSREARQILHKFVCRGSCDWFKSREPPERFKLNLSEKERTKVGQIVADVLGDEISEEEARRIIHGVICHPI